MKKKKKDGFTLTELIAVIAILALIVLISLPAYNSIRKRTLETQYNNTVALIETAAAKYASETGSSVALVQNLIDAGLIETDDGNNVLDPRDNSSLNCYPIEIKYVRGKYKATYLEEEVSSCEVDDAMAKYADISIIIQNKNTQSGKITGRWVPFDVIAKVEFDDEELVIQEGLKYNWVTSGGQTSTEPTIEISTKSVYNGTLNVQVTDKDNNRYFASTIVKLDKEKPIVEDVSVSCDGDCKNGRKVTIKATDKNGSGIGGYYVGTSTCTSSSTFINSNKTSHVFNLTAEEIKSAKPNYDTPATYYVCVKDKVGNTTGNSSTIPHKIIIDTKDTTPPECEWDGEAASETDWAQSRTITLSCKDEESGCDSSYDSYSRTFNDSNSVIRTQQLSYTIKDNAGNETVCSRNADVYVDTQAPTEPETTHIYEIWGSHSYSSAWVHHYNSDVGINGTWVTNGNDPYLAFFGVDYFGSVSGAYVELDSAINNDIYIQVFYSTSSTFTESNSKTVLLKAGEKKVVLPFSSNGNYINFRFDIGNKSGLRYKIKSLGLISSEKDWWKDYRNIQAVSSDEGSGIDKWYWRDNITPAWQEAGTDRISTDKYEYISVWKAEFDRTVLLRVCDKVGNCVVSKRLKAGVDMTPPTPPEMEFIYHDWPNRYVQGTSTNYDVYAGYEAANPGPRESTDELSGISHYEISDDNENWIKYEYEYTSGESIYHMISEGTHYRYFRAVDNVGNVSSSIERTAHIDKSGPNISLGTNGSTSYVGTASSEITVTDAAGVDYINYGFQTYSYQSSVAAQTRTTSGSTLSSYCGYSGETGNCYLHVWACDDLGNCSYTISNAFKIDRKPPTIDSVQISCSTSTGSPQAKIVIDASDDTLNITIPAGGYYGYNWTSPHALPAWPGSNNNIYAEFGYLYSSTYYHIRGVTMYDGVWNGYYFSADCDPSGIYNKSSNVCTSSTKTCKHWAGW